MDIVIICQETSRYQ